MSEPRNIERIQKFAAWLKEAIEKAGYPSPRQFALSTGISDATIYRLLQGKNRPDEETIKKIAPALKININEVMIQAGYPISEHGSADFVRMVGNTTSTFEDTNEILEFFHKRPEMKVLFSATKNATKEDIEQAVKIIEALKKS
jgi:transcriptional regulator with XRE-family HTH domain